MKDITLNGKLISQSSSPDAEIHGGATGETGNGVKVSFNCQSYKNKA